MRYLALDWGKKHIGVAKGDEEFGIAFPVGVLLNSSRIAEEIRTLCAKEHIDAFVLGVPQTMRGEEGPQAREILRFGDFLKRSTGLPVFFEDERFTTKIAARIFGPVRRTHADAIAASLILQSFFDRRKQKN